MSSDPTKSPQAGDRESFSRLARECQDRLYRFGLAQGLPSQDAADVVQEALTRAWQHRRRCRPGRSVEAWLFGIAMNCIRERRRSLRRDRLGLDGSLLAAPTGDGENHQPVALAAAMEKLPDRQREILACRYLRQMSVRETAETLGIAEGTVKAATSRALGNLRSILDQIAER